MSKLSRLILRKAKRIRFGARSLRGRKSVERSNVVKYSNTGICPFTLKRVSDCHFQEKSCTELRCKNF